MPGVTVLPFYTYTAGDSGAAEDIAATKVEWLVSDTNSGPWTAISTDREYMVTLNDWGKVLKLRVRPVDTNGNEGALYETNTAWYVGGQFWRLTWLRNGVEKTPAANVFKIEGSDREFILLDTTAGDSPDFLIKDTTSAKSKFLILSKELYNQRAYLGQTASDGKLLKFNPDSPDSLAEFLNSNDFFTDGIDGGSGNRTLPTEIVEHIDTDHMWPCEPGAANSNGGAAYTPYWAKAGISVMSLTEYVYYAGKYGYYDSPPNSTVAVPAVSDLDYVALRTPLGFDASNPYMMAYRWRPEAEISNASLDSRQNVTFYSPIIGNSEYRNPYIRPMFFLDEEFFTDAKINLDLAGENVKEAIRNTYSFDELSGIYSQDEIIGKLGIYPDPAKSFIENVVISNTMDGGEIRVGETITGSYTYKSGNANPEGATAKQWYISADGSSFDQIPGAAGDNLTLTWDYMGKYIAFEVAPKDSEGTEGYPARSPLEQVQTVTLARTAQIGAPSGTVENTPSENLFSVGGKEFIMLDSFNNDDSAFYVMAKSLYGTRPFVGSTASANHNTNKFDVNDDTTLAYWLNNTFPTAGNTLPAAIQSHINWNHEWITEPGAPNHNQPMAYTFNAGISLMAVWEYTKYAGKYGIVDGNLVTGTVQNWWTRTAFGTENSNATAYILAVNMTSSGPMGRLNAWYNNTTGIRPQFMLDKEFFTTVRPDSMGANVIKHLKKHYFIEDLRNLYTEAELIAMGLGYYYGMSADYSVYGDPLTAVDSVTGAASVQANVSLANNIASPKSGILVAVLYNGDKITEIDYRDVTLAGNSVTPEVIGFQTIPAGSNKLKLFLWDGFDTMRPIVKSKTLGTP
jgi:hypothetical protein